MGNENYPAAIFLAQQLNPSHWSWASDPAKAHLLHDTAQLGEYLTQQLEAIGCDVAESHIILHDSDTHAISAFGEHNPKRLHVHLAVKFKGGRKGSKSMKQMAKALGVAQQYICKPRDSYSHGNWLAYLIHAKDAQKFQYDPAKVITLRGRDYMDVYQQNKQDWWVGRAIKSQKRAWELLPMLREKVLDGEITYSDVLLDKENYDIAKWKMSVIQRDAAVALARKAALALEALGKDAFAKKIIYLDARSGYGKSWSVDWLVKLIEAKYGYSSFRPASEHPIDDYAGEEIIILDDTRANAMSATELIHLLDPNRGYRAGARYENTVPVCARLIVIIAPVDVFTYFYFAKNKTSHDEPVDQFFRRVNYEIEVLRIDGVPHFDIREGFERDTPLYRTIGDNIVTLNYGFRSLGTFNFAGFYLCVDDLLNAPVEPVPWIDSVPDEQTLEMLQGFRNEIRELEASGVDPLEIEKLNAEFENQIMVKN